MVKKYMNGDILKVKIEQYWQKPYYIVKDMRDLYLQFNRDDFYYRFNECEVIGNIHDNPELLKEE